MQTGSTCLPSTSHPPLTQCVPAPPALLSPPALPQALEAAQTAIRRFEAAGISWQRPTDYYAEMVKSDEHMAKVKEQLLYEKTQIEASELRCGGPVGCGLPLSSWREPVASALVCVCILLRVTHAHPACPLSLLTYFTSSASYSSSHTSSPACLFACLQEEGARGQEVWQAGGGAAQAGEGAGQEGSHHRHLQAAQAAREVGALCRGVWKRGVGWRGLVCCCLEQGPVERCRLLCGHGTTVC